MNIFCEKWRKKFVLVFWGFLKDIIKRIKKEWTKLHQLSCGNQNRAHNS